MSLLPGDDTRTGDFFSALLIGQSVRAVIFVDIGGMRSEGPIPKVFRCRTYSAPLITHLPYNSPYGLPY